MVVASAGPVCTSIQTDNHARTPSLSFYRPDALPAAQPTASKQWRHENLLINSSKYRRACTKQHLGPVVISAWVKMNTINVVVSMIHHYCRPWTTSTKMPSSHKNISLSSSVPLQIYTWIIISQLLQSPHNLPVDSNILLLFLTPVRNSQGMKKYAMQFKKVQKSRWNEPYSSSSFIKQSCSKTALHLLLLLL